MNQINFNELEFNLYDILNLPYNCTISDVRLKYKKLIKKFHPDKITKLEEKIYYYVTLAHHILSNVENRQKYDSWLKKSVVQQTDLKNQFKQEQENMKQYFPPTQEDAQYKFVEQNRELWNRHHDNFTEDKDNFDTRYSRYMDNRGKMKEIEQEKFSNMEDFNTTFTRRKNIDGKYNDKLIKINNKDEIMPYMPNNSMNYVELKDFNKLYVNDTIIASYYASLDIAFKLQPNIEDNRVKNNINKSIDKYNEMSGEFNHIYDKMMEDIDI